MSVHTIHEAWQPYCTSHTQHQASSAPDVPEGDEAGGVVAVVFFVAAAVKAAAADAQVDVAPQHGVGCGPVVVHVDVLQATRHMHWLDSHVRTVRDWCTSAVQLLSLPQDLLLLLLLRRQTETNKALTLPVPLTKAVECS